MSKIYLLFLAFAIVSTNAQTIVVDEKFTNNNFPIGYNFLPNKNRIIIQKGSSTVGTSNKILKSLYSYDHEGFSEHILTNANFMNCVFSPTENSFFISEFSKKSALGEQYKLYVDGSPTEFFKINDSYQFFNDTYQFSIVNQNFKDNVDFEKNDLYLDKNEIATGIKSKIKLTKPDLNRIQSISFAKYTNKISFGVRVNSDYFSLITKSISKDYTSSVVYRTNYSFNGILLDDFSYTVTIPKNFLVFSNNGGGIINTNASTGDTFISDLAINNFIVDKATQDVYIYGLIGKTSKSASNTTNEPSGFYVFKFDQTGKKIWESIQEIKDKIDFNSNYSIANIRLHLTIVNDKILVYTGSEDSTKGYVHYAILDDKNGKQTKTNKIFCTISQTPNVKEEDGNFLFANFSNPKTNLYADSLTRIALENNEKFSNYIDKFDTKNVSYFKTFINKSGVWVIESDNKSYYKVLYFKNEFK